MSDKLIIKKAAKKEVYNFYKLAKLDRKRCPKNLEFEEAAKLRDRIKYLRDKLVGHS